MLYNHNLVEKKGQDYGQENKTYQFIDEINKPKFYCLDMFPYPSGSGLHVGHLKGYLATEIYARYKKMKGYCVLHPIGWDAFGLPAEQYALNTGNHPSSFTNENINYFREQLKKIGFCFDYDKEVNTTDPEYYQGTQWIFLQLYKNNLAYVDNVNVNWCERLKSVLANEEVITKNNIRVSERGDYPVVYKPMKQWVLKITDYADKLLGTLDELDGPEGIKSHQIKGIGRKNQYRISFTLNDYSFPIDFDALSHFDYLVSIVINQYHPLVEYLQKNYQEFKVSEYFTDSTNVNDYHLPISISGPVDNKQYSIILTKKLQDNGPQLVCSYSIPKDQIDLSNEDKLVDKYKDIYQQVVVYHLRDGIFSRQRYWGEPIPIYFDQNNNSYADENLPLLLPQITDFAPSDDGQSPLAKQTDWVNFTIDGKQMTRESNTMPNGAGSCWYYLAYLLKKPEGGYIPLNSQQAYDIFKRGLPVDVYIGGQEHAVLHLLYARFGHQFLYDINVVPNREPFFKLVNQGMILGPDNQKMSKSKGNVINPDDIVYSHGADALRLYMCFMGPLSLSLPGNEDNLNAARKGLDRVYILFTNLDQYEKVSDDDQNLLSLGAHLVDEFECCIPKHSFNLGVSSMMKFINQINKLHQYSNKILKTFLKILSFYCPHIAEELGSVVFKEKESIYLTSFDHYDPSLLIDLTYQLPITINNKLKLVVDIDQNITDQQLVEDIVLSNDKIKSTIGDKNITKIVYVPKKIFNIIVS